MIKFVDADAQTIANEMIKAYQQEVGQVLYPGDPRRIFLLQFVPIILGLKNDINYTANQNLLPYASGDMLDALGVRVGVTRLPAKKARTTMRFTLSAVQPNDITIPAGTRVTPDGASYFATISDLTIPAGNISGDVVAESTEGGSRFNGYAPGQISIIVDPIPYVAIASNIDTSGGGADRESDDAYRERQRLAPSSFSVAGPSGAYIYHAKSSDINIADVAVVSPNPCEVDVYVLMQGGQMPDESVINKVTAALNDRSVRPLTDKVTVLTPDVVNYDIDLTYYISTDRAAEVAMIQEAIEGPGGAIDQYVDWQHGKIGRAITPDELLVRMYAAGAARIILRDPEYSTIDVHEVAKLGMKSITYGGLI